MGNVAEPSYSICLMPEAQTFKKLQKLINELAEKYSGQKFEPHITLLGGKKESMEELTIRAFSIKDLVKILPNNKLME